VTSAGDAIDFEHHYIPPAMYEAYRSAPAGTPGAIMAAVAAGQARFAVEGNRPAGRPYELEPRIAEMEDAGVGLALLSVATLDQYPASESARPAVAALISRCNDELLEGAAAFPGRFGMLATLPFPYADACLLELDRLAGEGLVRGVIAHAASDEWTLDRADLQPVFEKIAAAQLPVLLHPAAEGVHRHRIFGEYNLEPGIAGMVETTTIAARLMLSGMLDRVSDLVLIIPHLGGTLPYLAGRVTDTSGSGAAEHDVRYYLRNRVRLGTCSFHEPALHCAVETAGAENIILATDYPFRGTLRRAVDDVRASFLSAAEQEGVLRDNALALGAAVPSAA
jgi:predicted TIM-barrel fold metal-dependent hydrolase